MKTIMYHQQTLTTMGRDLTQVHIITSLRPKGWMVKSCMTASTAVKIQAAENYMKNNILQYEDDCGKQRHCIKNIIMKGRHQFLGYFNTLLLSNTRGPEAAYDFSCQYHVYKEKSSSADADEDKDDKFEMHKDDDQVDSDVQTTTTPAKQKFYSNLTKKDSDETETESEMEDEQEMTVK
eukprot:5016999-Ditylum_brightwellii.AAC.1